MRWALAETNVDVVVDDDVDDDAIGTNIEKVQLMFEDGDRKWLHSNVCDSNNSVDSKA